MSITISLLNYYGLYHSETISSTIFFLVVFNPKIEKYITQLAHGGATCYINWSGNTHPLWAAPFPTQGVLYKNRENKSSTSIYVLLSLWLLAVYVIWSPAINSAKWFHTVTYCNMALWGKEMFSPSGCFLLVCFITATGKEIRTVVSSHYYLLLIGAIFLIQILKLFLVSPVSVLDVKYFNLYYKVTEFQTSIRL